MVTGETRAATMDATVAPLAGARRASFPRGARR